MNDNAVNHVNVLSLDGGGRRGYLQLALLSDLRRRLGRPLHEVFQYVAGTSTGGLIALGIGHRHEPDQLRQLYEQDLPKIFYRSFWHRVKTLWGLLGPKYSDKGLHDALYARFQGMYTDLAATNVVVTSYDLQKRRPRLWKSWRDETPTWFAAYATAAAPTYFPALLGRYVDGGVAMSDPSMAILTDVMERHPGASVTLVSIGTGTHEDGIMKDPGGLLGWSRKVADVLLDGPEDAIQHEVKRQPIFQQPGSNYFRFQTELTDPRSRPMDGVVDAPLYAAAHRFLDESSDQMAKVVEALRV